MDLQNVDVQEVELWIQNNTSIQPRNSKNIKKLLNMIKVLNHVYLNVTRHVSLVAVFLISHDLLREDALLKQGLSDEFNQINFDFALIQKLCPRYKKSEILLFIDACLFLKIPVYASGRILNVAPAKKNATVSQYVSLTNLGYQVSFLEKLSDDDSDSSNIKLKSTEMNSVIKSYKHIVKNLRFENLIPPLLLLLKTDKSKLEILKDLGNINTYQFNNLVQLAVDRGFLNMDEVEKVNHPIEKKELIKEPETTVLLSPSNYKCVKEIADSKFGGNMYQAVNAIITALRTLQDKHILDDNFKESSL